MNRVEQTGKGPEEYRNRIKTLEKALLDCANVLKVRSINGTALKKADNVLGEEGWKYWLEDLIYE